jgi:hypothetical protein
MTRATILSIPICRKAIRFGGTFCIDGGAAIGWQAKEIWGSGDERDLLAPI